jgi:histidine triad (HIT) family protein
MIAVAALCRCFKKAPIRSMYNGDWSFSIMDHCIFCKIVNGSAKSRIVFENENILGFEDLNPQAPTHILIVPKKHIATLNDATPEDQSLLGEVILSAAAIARERHINSSGYRLVANTNAGAGQSVFHVHFHLLGGRSLAWPPG